MFAFSGRFKQACVVGVLTFGWCACAGVVGFLAVCCLVGVLMYKHRRWWRNGNGNYKNGSEKGSEDDGPADP